MNHKQFSSKGGKAGRGKAKARTSEQARAAVMVRWSKPRKTNRVTRRANEGSVYWDKHLGYGFNVRNRNDDLLVSRSGYSSKAAAASALRRWIRSH